MKKRKPSSATRRLQKKLSPAKVITGLLHSVYKITIGVWVYYGYTSRAPLRRLDEHIEEAKNGARKLLHSTLRDNDYLFTFEVVYESKIEPQALMKEIEYISKNIKSLNLTSGGEGFQYHIKLTDGKYIISRK